MPGEFVISPRHPVSGQPISGSRRPASQDQGKPQDNVSQAQSDSRPSLESSDSTAKEKQKASGMRAALSKAKHRFSSSSHSSGNRDVLAGSEEEFNQQRKEQVEKQKREGEYAEYNLGKKGLGKGGMQMGG